ncbi:MAG: thioredoxin [Deltaproteobacteria bacterium]|nr:thioredoxin [Deltaproteobacteria bacterium]
MDREQSFFHVSDLNFEDEVIRSNKPVLVDFWAGWCGPCKAVGPIVDEIAKTYGDRIKIVHLNVDENPQMTAAYSIKNIPTIILFNNGKPMDTLVGLIPEERLKEFVSKAL